MPYYFKGASPDWEGNFSLKTGYLGDKADDLKYLREPLPKEKEFREKVLDLIRNYQYKRPTDSDRNQTTLADVPRIQFRKHVFLLSRIMLGSDSDLCRWAGIIFKTLEIIHSYGSLSKKNRTAAESKIKSLLNKLSVQNASVLKEMYDIEKHRYDTGGGGQRDKTLAMRDREIEILDCVLEKISNHVDGLGKEESLRKRSLLTLVKCAVYC